MVKDCLQQTESEFGLHGGWGQVDIDTSFDPYFIGNGINMELRILCGKLKHPWIIATCKGTGQRLWPEHTVEICLRKRHKEEWSDSPKWKFRCTDDEAHNNKVQRIV